MEPVFTVVALGITAAGVYLAYNNRKKWRTALRLLAEERKWSLNEGGFLSRYEVLGFEGIRTVKVSSESRGKNSVATVIEVASPLEGISSLSKEGFAAGLNKMLTGQDVQLDMPAADDRWLLRGDERTLLARLSASSVEGIDEFLDRDGRVADGVLRLTHHGYVSEFPKLSALVDTALQASRILDPDEPDDDQSLVANVGRGPTPLNRRRCFESIIEPAARAQGATILLDDPDPINRMVGAMAANRADVLAELCDADSGLSLSERVDALRALAQIEPDMAESILHTLAEFDVPGSILHTLAEFDVPGFEIVLALAAELKVALSLPNLVQMTRHAGLDVRRALPPALALHGPTAEQALITLVEDSDDLTAIAAAEALTAVGTLAAVHPLMQRSDGILRSGDLKKAARDAIATIQLRHGSSQRGGLTLANDEQGGGLAMADEAADE